MDMGVVIAIIIVSAVLAAAIMQSETNNLVKKFRDLGVLSGKSLGEITAIVGAPQHISILPEGKMLYQWHSAITNGASHYHIALIFYNNFCEGVSSESMTNP